MTMDHARRFNDADLRRYLNARAQAVASRAAAPDEMAARVAVELGLIRRRRSGPARVLRLAVVVALLAAFVAGALYLIGRFREDYAPAQPEITVNLHGSPWAVAALDGSIWAAGYIEGVLFEIEPTSGEILAEIPTGKRICGEIAAEFGYLWLTTCEPNAWLERVDPETHRIDRLNGYGGDRIAFGGGRVWMIHDGVLEGVDPLTLATVERIPVERNGILVHAFDSIWISDADGQVVARVDLEAGEVVAEIVLPAPEAYPVHLTVGDGAIWVVDEVDLRVYRIDPATNTPLEVDIDLRVIDGTGFGDHPIAFGGAGLWVRESERSIARIDTQTLTVAERVDTEPFGGGAFVVTEDAVWYSNLKGESVVGLQRP